MSIAGVPPLIRQNTMGDLEMIDLAPKVEGRIRKLDAQVLAELKAKREKDLSKKTIFEIDEEEFTVTKNEISLPGEDLL